MIYNLYSTKDSTIYNPPQYKNTGMDPQLVLQSYYDINTYTNQLTKSITRVLLDFEPLKSDKYLQYKQNIQSASINLKISDMKLQTGQQYNIYCHPIEPNSEWQMGIGVDAYKYYYDGVNWVQRNKKYNWNSLGGDYLQQVTSGSFTYINNDYISIPISASRIEGHTNGYIIKFSQQHQNSTSSNVGRISFYSTQTNTIYCPILQIYINDFEYNSGSFTQLNDPLHSHLYINNIKSQFSQQQVYIFNVVYKNIIHDRTWTTSYWSQPEYIIPINSIAMYRIYDVTDFEKELIFDFNTTYSRISCDSIIGNYFMLDMSQFYVNRYYQLELMIKHNNGHSQIFNNKYVFKIK